nr:alpha/beta hydrolase [Lysobacter sp.]
VLTQAREVTDATAAFMVNSGAAAAGLRDVKHKYADAPWWTSIRGEFSGDILKYPVWVVRLALPFFDNGTPWNHDPIPVLKAVSAPQLWMLAEQDLEAPHAETVRRLATLADSGHEITTVVFPDTDHGIVEFETAPDGTRTKTRYADGYLQMTMDWIRDGQLADRTYGRALVSPPVPAR